MVHTSTLPEEEEAGWMRARGLMGGASAVGCRMWMDVDLLWATALRNSVTVITCTTWGQLKLQRSLGKCFLPPLTEERLPVDHCFGGRILSEGEAIGRFPVLRWLDPYPCI